MPSLISEILYAIRTLRKSPGFTAVAVLTLALGIGANTAIFSVLKRVLLDGLPYSNAERLLLLMERAPDGDRCVAYPNFVDWRSQARLFEGMAAFRTANFVVTGPLAERVPGKLVSAEFFNTVGMKPALGRTFLAEEDAPGGNQVAMLSEGFWRRRFGGDPSILGRAITVQEEPRTIVGVLPAGFRLYGEADVYIPLAPLAHNEARNNHSAMWVVARMKPGVTVEQARVEMETIARRLEQQYPSDNAGETITVKPIREALAGWMRGTLLVLFGAVALVLLIACVNLANLMLARAVGREREFAVRAALGAGRWRAGREIVTESVLLALAGGLAGLVLAAVSLKSLVAVAPGDITAGGVPIDGWVLAFTLAVSCCAGILFSLAPAGRTDASKLGQMLKEGGRAGTRGIAHQRFGDLLLAGQVMLALILLAGAGLLVRSARNLLAVNPGFNPERVLTMRLLPSETRFMKAAMVGDRMDIPRLVRSVGPYQLEMLRHVQNLPGITAAATAFPIPMAGETCQMNVLPEGRPEPAGGRYTMAHYYVISPGYFRTMRIPQISGRIFSLRDDASAPRVALINQTMARLLWPGEDPVGKRFRFPGVREFPDWLLVAGVVGDTRHAGPHAEPPPQFYMSFLQWPQAMFLVARTEREPMQAANTLRTALSRFDREMPVYDVRTMEERMARSRSYRNAVTLLLLVFSALALVLTAVGIYGVTAYSVTQRQQEIGIRMALGARAGNVIAMVVGRVLALALAGVAAGLAGAGALTHLIANLLFGVSATDPATFLAAGAGLCAMAALAAYLPARRAVALDPLNALRCA